MKGLEDLLDDYDRRQDEKARSRQAQIDYDAAANTEAKRILKSNVMKVFEEVAAQIKARGHNAAIDSTLRDGAEYGQANLRIELKKGGNRPASVLTYAYRGQSGHFSIAHTLHGSTTNSEVGAETVNVSMDLCSIENVQTRTLRFVADVLKPRG